MSIHSSARMMMPSGATDLNTIFHQLHQCHSHFKRRYSDMFHQNRHIQQVYVIVRQVFTNFDSNIKYIIHPYPELSRTIQNYPELRSVKTYQETADQQINDVQNVRSTWEIIHSSISSNKKNIKQVKPIKVHQKTHLKQVSNDIFTIFHIFPQIFPQIFPPPQQHLRARTVPCWRSWRAAGTPRAPCTRVARSSAGRSCWRCRTRPCRDATSTRGWWCWCWGWFFSVKSLPWKIHEDLPFLRGKFREIQHFLGKWTVCHGNS